MKKPSKNTKRAYAIASYINATLKAYECDNQELKVLHRRSINAMNVFSRVCGIDATVKLSNELSDLWGRMADNHSTTITNNNIPALVEGFCMIMPPKEFKEFFGLPTYEKQSNRYMKYYSQIMSSVNELNHELNNLLGTKSVSMNKPKQKTKKPTREKVKSSKQNKHERDVLAHKERKLRVKSFLRDRIKNAKETI